MTEAELLAYVEQQRDDWKTLAQQQADAMLRAETQLRVARAAIRAAAALSVGLNYFAFDALDGDHD